MARKVAFIGTGGTIASIGKGPLDLIDYGANNTMVHAEDIVTAIPSVREIAEIDGVAGIMLTFDDFIVGMEQFGRYIQPLMKSRAHVLQAAA